MSRIFFINLKRGVGERLIDLLVILYIRLIGVVLVLDTYRW